MTKPTMTIDQALANLSQYAMRLTKSYRDAQLEAVGVLRHALDARDAELRHVRAQCMAELEKMTAEIERLEAALKSAVAAAGSATVEFSVSKVYDT